MAGAIPARRNAGFDDALPACLLPFKKARRVSAAMPGRCACRRAHGDELVSCGGGPGTRLASRAGRLSGVERVVERPGGNPSAASAVSAISHVIGAASALSARGRGYGKEKVYGSIP